jgi:hypothetical protein
MEDKVAGNLKYCVGNKEETCAQAIDRGAELEIDVHAQSRHAYIGAINEAHEEQDAEEIDNPPGQLLYRPSLH